MRSRQFSATTLVVRRVAAMTVRAATFAVCAATTLRAQDTEPDRLAKLDQNCRITIQILIDSAEVAGLPARALRSIALEGVSKKADCKAIIAADRQELALLRTARSTLGPVDPEELTAAAAAARFSRTPARVSSSAQLPMMAVNSPTVNAARVPLRVAKDAVKVMELALKCAREANLNAISDSMSGFAMSRAALTAACYNVRINLNSLEDQSVGEKMLEELKELESKADNLEKEIQKIMDR